MTDYIIDGVTNPTFVPGEQVQVSGIYDQLDDQGNPVGQSATCTEGEVFPPTLDNAFTWRLREASNLE